MAANAHGMGVANKTFPNVLPFFRDFMQKQNFYLSFGFGLHANQSSRNDFGVVTHHNVSRPKVIQNIVENFVFNRLMFSVNDH